MNRQALDIFHSIYYGSSASAVLLMVWESWTYGFFFTPFPFILTLMFIVYVCATAVSAFDIFKPVRWLGSPMASGFFKMNWARQLTLAGSVLAFIYLGTSYAAQTCFDGSASSVQRAQSLISIDGVLFGSKRAEGWMRRFAGKAEEMKQLDIADQFLMQHLDSVRNHHRSPEALADAITRVVANHMHLRASRSIHHQIDNEKSL